MCGFATISSCGLSRTVSENDFLGLYSVLSVDDVPLHSPTMKGRTVDCLKFHGHTHTQWNVGAAIELNFHFMSRCG